MLEGRCLTHPDEGTPQGGVISPLLANIYLHDVLDDWFVNDVQPVLVGRANLVRFADDFVVIFDRKDEAERFLQILPERFSAFGLTLHPDKTRLVPFRRPDRVDDDDDRPGTFNFLGFTHYWTLSRRGKWFVMQKTAKDRFGRSLRRVREWCRLHRHDSLESQQRAIAAKLNGHYAYYGLTANFDAIARFLYEVQRARRAALARRSQQALPWRKMSCLLERYALPPPRIFHRYGT